MKNQTFYDELSIDYDVMINPKKIIPDRATQLKTFFENPSGYALDAGCGSGVDSIVLSKIGYKVTGVDQSEQMILLAKQNSKNYNTEINFISSNLAELNDSFNNYFDVAVTLGNTLSNINPKGVKNFLLSVNNLLKDNGKLLIQIINYDRLIAMNERIVNITENDENIFVRFNDYLNDKIMFNILKIDKKNLSQRNIITTEIFNHTVANLKELLSLAGFNNITFFGGLNGIEFIPEKSHDIVILVNK